jgi:hypothetical protein
VKSLPLGETGILDGRVPSARRTVYRAVGLNGIMLMIAILCAALLAIGWICKTGMFRRRN